MLASGIEANRTALQSLRALIGAELLARVSHGIETEFMVAPNKLYRMEFLYPTKHAKYAHMLYTDQLIAFPGAGFKSLPGPPKTTLLRLLTLAFRSPATLDSLSLRLVDVVCRNPAFIIRFGARGNSRPIGSYNRNLVCGINLLRLARRLLSPFAAFSSATLLWEQGADPRAVNEVACTAKGSAEEKVEKYATSRQRRTASRQ